MCNLPQIAPNRPKVELALTLADSQIQPQETLLAYTDTTEQLRWLLDVRIQSFCGSAIFADSVIDLNLNL